MTEHHTDADTLRSTAPRTTARLMSFLYRAAADLSAATINARSAIEAEHARRGRALCAAMFVDLAAATTPSDSKDLLEELTCSHI